jgi:hypothetical protein
MADKGPAGALARPRFEAGDRLGAKDLAAEQAWRRQRLRRHNRHLHGWGVACGLWVAPALDGGKPWAVVVCPGYAVGPYGDEIAVSCAPRVDLREWIWSRPSDKHRTAYVAIRFAEAAIDPRSVGTNCGCTDSATRMSAVREHFRIDVLWTPSAVGAITAVDLCHDIPACAPCPPTAYVLLAGIRLPSDEGTAITRADIDLSVRRMI